MVWGKLGPYRRIDGEMPEVGLFNDLRHFPIPSCLFIPTLSTVMGTSTEYSVSGGIGTGRCVLGGRAC